MYLYETTATVNLAGQTVPLRLAQGRGYNQPSAPGYYAPVLSDTDGVVFTRSIYSSSLAFGMGSVDAGVVTGVAMGGEYDWLADAGMGKEARLLVGIEETAYNDLVVFAVGKATAALVGNETFEIGWEDKTSVLTEKISKGTFLGTNSGTTGLEGLSTDIKGRSYPRTFGKVKNIAPFLANASNRTYSWNYSRTGTRVATTTIDAVRVRGSAWTFTADYATPALLAAASISVGYYGTCKAQSLLRMGGSTSIDGNVRIDVTVGTARVGAIVSAILQEIGETSGTISLTDLAALDAAAAYDVGYYATDDAINDVIDDLLKSILAYGIVDNLGVYRFGRIPTVTGSASLSIRQFGVGVAAKDTDVNLIKLEPLLDNTKNIPASKVTVKYRRRWDVESIADLATGLTDVEKADISSEWLSTDPVTTGVDIMYPNATEVEFSTLLLNSADASTIRGQLATLVGKPPKNYKVTIAAEAGTIDILRPGVLVDLFYDRFGLDSGYQFIVTQVGVNTQSNVVSLVLRGIDNV